MKYIVIDKPVSVRDMPSHSGNIINAFPPMYVVDIVEEEHGWLRTSTNQWILSGENIVPKAQWDKDHPTPEPQTVDPILAEMDSITMNMGTTYLKPGDSIRLNGKDMEDPVTGNTIHPSYSSEKTILYVKRIEEDGSALVYDGGQEFHVNPTAAQRLDPKELDKWDDIKEEDVVQSRRDSAAIAKAESGGILESVSDWIAGIEAININSTRSIFGMPYQFTPIADNRIDGSFNQAQFGRLYAQKIATRMPVLILQAGIPEFMQGYSSDAKDIMSKGISDSLSLLADKSAIDDMINKAGKMYAFKAVPTEYYDVVNPMCRAIANLLNIDGVSINIDGGGEELGSIDWLKYSQHSKWGYYAGSVCFYVNSEPQVNESFSNSTTQSQIASKINDVGRAGTELQFLLGGASNKLSILDNARAGTDEESVKGSSESNSGGLLDNLIGNIQTLLAGGRMAFPEIWSDSSMMRSYNITIKLDSPTADVLSLYLNILVPLCHILGLVSPRSLGYNNYIAPFLVRAYYKSMFHVDLGIITDCQIQKGDVGAWSQNGLPTQVIVQLTIKDLYDVMAVSLNRGTNDLVSNPAQLDYLANMCGINIGTPDIYRTWKLWMAIRGKNRITTNISHAWSNLMIQCYRKWNNLLSSDWTM
jgi:hypothetical protein|nr:MAG TPA: hypothetical protein [Caudoviricetes sp.]